LDYSKFLKSAQCHNTSYEEFQQYIVKQTDTVAHAVKILQRRREIGLDRPDAPPCVAIDVARPDVTIANLIIHALASRANVSALDYEIDRAKLADAVSHNDGIIMVFAESREGQTRINAHFPTICKVQHRQGVLDIAIGDGLASKHGALPYPRGPSVHVIKIDPQQEKVDSDTLDKFFARVQENAARRLQ
jgi:hypothetical protein